LTTSSIQDGQAPGDATVRKGIFRDNFVIFRRRSKNSILETVNFSVDVKNVPEKIKNVKKRKKP